MNQVTFSGLVDIAVDRAKEFAAPFVPSMAQYEMAMKPVCRYLESLDDPKSFIRATHRGAGTMDVVAVELFKSKKF